MQGDMMGYLIQRQGVPSSPKGFAVTRGTALRAVREHD
jgi:hypothetical protein